MTKVLLILVAVLIVCGLILFFVLKSKSNKIERLEKTIKLLDDTVNSKQAQIDNLMGEIEIERKHKKELAKKLADISTMSIDNILSQLQND